MSVFCLDPRHTRSLTHSLEAHSVTNSFLEEVSTDNFDRAPSVNFRLQFYSYTEFPFLLLSFSFESFPVYLFVLHLDDDYSNNNFRPVFGERGE